ncbi:hypothetical protein P9597_29985 [Aneurinibacillus migulanus]|uniref:hypothetical protein n=1 Tax=Aneurinibacillus migulanus TaxID=47500 RepID=UPI002E212CB1|nr:hypothetical protein [Aneurinibacillus migulanus]
MRYVKAQGVEEGEFYYFEIDADRITYRQIVVMDEQQVMTSIAPHFHLSEKAIDFLIGDEWIDKNEFEVLWNKAIEPYRKEWNQAKQQYGPGRRVKGEIVMFYPQGIIIKISDTVFAVANDEEVRSQAKAENLYPGYEIHGTIRAYDEDNFWLVLKDCNMTGEKFSG